MAGKSIGPSKAAYLKSVEEFQQNIKGSSHVGQLKKLGLTDAGIELVLTNTSKQPRYVADQTDERVMKFCHSMAEVDAERLQIIEEKFTTYLRQQAVQRLSSRDSSCDNTIASQDQSSDYLKKKFHVSGSENTNGSHDATDVSPLCDPIHRLKEIWDEFAESHGIRVEGKRRRKRAERLRQREGDLLLRECANVVENSEQDLVAGCLTNEDAKRSEYFIETLGGQSKKYSTESEDNHSITNEPVAHVLVTETVNTKHSNSNSEGSRSRKIEEIPEEVIERHRITIEQIREMERFQDYEIGLPSNQLYIKNLSSKVTEEDLMSMFSRFEDSSSGTIQYRLLKGRMHGQAFVTFPDIETTTKALRLVNGYDFQGKSKIVQYGKSSRTNTKDNINPNSPDLASTN